MKKKQKTILTILVGLLCLTACNNTEYKIKKNAEKYINAMAEYDISAARPYATEETQHATLDFIESNILPTIDSNYIHQNTPAQITIDSVIVSSDTSATVYFRKTTPIQKNTAATLHMRQRDGKWLAHQVVDFTIRFGTKQQTE